MLSLFTFIMGLVMAIKGNFRLFNRQVSKRDGRLAGVVLMAPLIFEFCFVFTMSFSMVSENMLVGEDGTFSISAQVFETYVNQVLAYSNLFLITQIIAVTIAAVIIFRSPRFDLPTTATQASYQPVRQHPLHGPELGLPNAAPRQATAPPAIMTIPEAAAYMHLTPAEIEQMIDEGRLPAARSPGGFRIARSALDEVLRGEL